MNDRADDRLPTDDVPPSAASTPSSTGRQPELTKPVGVPLRTRIARGLMIAVGVLFGIFAIFNSQYVEFNWIFGKTEIVTVGNERISGGVPLILLLLASFGAGFAVATVSGMLRRRTRAKRNRPQQHAD